jgi:hypothetical protein
VQKKMSGTNDVASQLYTGASTFGKYWSVGVLVVSGICALVLVGVGIWYLWFKHEQDWTKTVATIVEITGVTLTVEFTTTSTTIVRGQLQWPSGVPMNFKVGQTIIIYYDRNNVSSLTLDLPKMSDRTVGLVSILIGGSLIAFGGFQYWIASSSKAGAAAIGAVGFWDLFGR